VTRLFVVVGCAIRDGQVVVEDVSAPWCANLPTLIHYLAAAQQCVAMAMLAQPEGGSGSEQRAVSPPAVEGGEGVPEEGL
jgi:hypothetical protein